VCLAAPVRERVDRGPWPIACCLEPKSEFSHPARPDLTAWVVALWCCSDASISALICRAATEADIDPDRVKFLRTVRIVRRQVADPAAFSP